MLSFSPVRLQISAHPARRGIPRLSVIRCAEKDDRVQNVRSFSEETGEIVQGDAQGRREPVPDARGNIYADEAPEVPRQQMSPEMQVC